MGFFIGIYLHLVDFDCNRSVSCLVDDVVPFSVLLCHNFKLFRTNFWPHHQFMIYSWHFRACVFDFRKARQKTPRSRLRKLSLTASTWLVRSYLHFTSYDLTISVQGRVNQTIHLLHVCTIRCSWCLIHHCNSIQSSPQ